MRRKAGREVGRQKCNEQIWAQNVEECWEGSGEVGEAAMHKDGATAQVRSTIVSSSRTSSICTIVNPLPNCAIDFTENRTPGGRRSSASLG